MNVKWSSRVHNRLSSQIAGCLNKAPIKVQCLSLLLVLVVTGSTNAHSSSFTFSVLDFWTGAQAYRINKLYSFPSLWSNPNGKGTKLIYIYMIRTVINDKRNNQSARKANNRNEKVLFKTGWSKDPSWEGWSVNYNFHNENDPPL